MNNLAPAPAGCRVNPSSSDDLGTTDAAESLAWRVAMGMRRHPRGDFAFVGVTPTQADVAYQPAAILNSPHLLRILFMDILVEDIL